MYQSNKTKAMAGTFTRNGNVIAKSKRKRNQILINKSQSDFMLDQDNWLSCLVFKTIYALDCVCVCYAFLPVHINIRW